MLLYKFLCDLKYNLVTKIIIALRQDKRTQKWLKVEKVNNKIRKLPYVHTTYAGPTKKLMDYPQCQVGQQLHPFTNHHSSSPSTLLTLLSQTINTGIHYPHHYQCTNIDVNISLVSHLLSNIH